MASSTLGCGCTNMPMQAGGELMAIVDWTDKEQSWSRVPCLSHIAVPS